MKTSLFSVLAGGILVLGSSVAIAQASQKMPSYDPIKPIQLNVSTLTVLTNQMVSIFDYSENSVFYRLNGRETVDKAEFIRRIKQARAGIFANRIVVGALDANQKRVIEVDYVVR